MSRYYTDEVYGSARWILENRVNMRGSVATLGPLTPARAKRLQQLLLADGEAANVADGFAIRLSGLGEKTAAEAQRLGIAAIT